MSINNLFPLFCALLLFSCSAPDEPVEDYNGDAVGKWADENLREIHDHKHNRNTSGLIEFLDHEEVRYRAEAAMALGSVQDSSALPALAETVNDNEPEVRLMAAFALGQLRSAGAAEVLIELVEADTTTAIRTEALEAIGKCDAPAAAEFLQNYQPRFLFDESGQAWGIYHLALNIRAEAEHAQIMVAGLYSEYEEIRLAAAHFFSRYKEPVQDQGMQRLVQLASGDPSAEVRMAAADALGFHELPDRVEILSRLVIYDEHPGVRVNAIRALTAIEASAETITEALFDGNPNVATAAAHFFQKHPHLADVDRLTQQIVAHPVSAVRGALFAAVLQQRKDNNEVVRQLIQAIEQADPEERAPLVEALAFAPLAAGYLDSLTFYADAEIATTALAALLKQYEASATNCNDWNKLVNQLIARADYGQLAVLGNRIKDEEFSGRACLEDIPFTETMAEIQLPEGIEAWIELNQARSSLTGEPLHAMPEMEYVAINWNRLDAAGSHPEIVVQTTRGAFTMVLLPEDAPATISHLLELIDEGYFSGKTFHRVVPNFVVQTGCPRGDGFGSGETLLRSEFSPIHYGPGVAGMASMGKDTESSQWFVTHRTTPHLDGRYTIFGAVVEGMGVVWELTSGDVIESIEVRNKNEDL